VCAGRGRTGLALGLVGQVWALGLVGHPSTRPVRAEEAAVTVDADVELRLSSPSPLPLLGPRFAPVTLDLFLPFGSRFSDSAFKLVMRIVRESAGADVRVQWRPTLGTPIAERGAEAAWEACQQQPGRCFTFLEQLYLHPEWLQPGRDPEELLLGAAQRHGLDAARLGRALTQHSHRSRLNAMWQAQRDVVRLPPEVWVNGRCLRSGFIDLQLAAEVDRQLVRAQKALREGARLSEIYEQMVTEERSGRSELPSSIRTLSAPLTPRSPVVRPSTVEREPRRGLPRLDLSSAPSRGPSIAPVTVVLVGSIDAYATFSLARAATEVWQRHADQVRFCYLHAPRSEMSRHVAELLAQAALLDPDQFWRSFDALVELLPRRFLLRQRDVEDALRRFGDLQRLEAALASKQAAAVVQRDLDQVRRLGIEYAPLVLVNGRPVRGASQVDVLERVVKEELSLGLLSRLRRPPPRDELGWLTH
jgi:predicted DsbA family dithiol-disulfide isomerase